MVTGHIPDEERPGSRGHIGVLAGVVDIMGPRNGVDVGPQEEEVYYNIDNLADQFVSFAVSENEHRDKAPTYLEEETVGPVAVGRHRSVFVSGCRQGRARREGSRTRSGAGAARLYSRAMGSGASLRAATQSSTQSAVDVSPRPRGLVSVTGAMLRARGKTAIFVARLLPDTS